MRTDPLPARLTRMGTLHLPQLARARIASPCHVRWEDMTPTDPTDRTRHCAQCDLHVHNLAGMPTAEAEAFLAARFAPDGTPLAGRVCGVLFQRADGTLLTADCPVGLAALRAKARRAVARAAAAIGLTTLVAWVAANQSAHTPFSAAQPFATLSVWLKGVPPAPPMAGRIMVLGDIAPLPVPPNPDMTNGGRQ